MYIDGEMSLDMSMVNDRIYIIFAEEPVYKHECFFWNPRLHQEEIAIFNQLAERNKDTEWNGPLYDDFGNIRIALANNYRSINAVSDAAWDDKHPAGTSLNDILEFDGYTYHECIELGYKVIHPDLNGGDKYRVYHRKFLNQLTEDDLRTLEPGNFIVPMLNILFASTPSIDKEHTITLTMTTIDGEEQVASIKCKPVQFQEPIIP